MSAPNADKPNEGIVGQISNSIGNAANYVSDTIQGKSAEASKEANKEQAKGNTPNSSIGDRVSGATGAISDKMTQEKHEGSAKVNKESI
ncbi:Putative glucose-repressible protein Grg1 [Septoria linicola]|uniref:Glucose-repressible protein Grg1 n=1 Tax=Septoria linicola TaxID=215465 RepID=A0A9Q9B0C5_9PEZI|nr:putative glucose-repressible protein Grg1 [Septoria linicola]USW59362.1 Putative glucose-repressible protein Grg1 [Septoria linicola]